MGPGNLNSDQFDRQAHFGHIPQQQRSQQLGAARRLVGDARSARQRGDRQSAARNLRRAAVERGIGSRMPRHRDYS